MPKNNASVGVGEPAWVALTDTDRQAVHDSLPNALDGFLKLWGWLHFAKAIEAKVHEKNAHLVASSLPQEVKALTDVVEEIAQEWDGCEYDAPGGAIPIGDAIRAKGGRLLRERALRGAQEVNQTGQPDTKSERPSQENCRYPLCACVPNLNSWAGCQAYKGSGGGAQEVKAGEAEFRAGVRQIVSALQNREWADLLTTDRDLAALEEEVAKLIGVRNAA